MHDVLVALPDLAEAAPVVDAVFGTAPEARRIPYTITGRPRTLANPVARALADLIAVARSRWAASEVFGLLRHPCIARRFEFDAAELDTLERWLRRAGIRWGCDAADRQTSGLPADNYNSFADGLERLFLGYAMPTPEHTLAGTLPYDDIEGSDAWVLGRFFAFVEALRELRARLSGAKDCGQWSAVFHGALDGFLAPDAGEQTDLDDVRRDVRALLIGDMRSAGSAFPVAADVAVAALAEAMDAAARGGTPSGYVTFAALPSLRGLHYRVICLLGLDDQKFPAIARPPEFDLMAAQPAPGDRQRRDDDRNLFLDHVMGARERLYLSYTGRDLRDNARLQPSIVVAELLDYLVDAAVGEDARRCPHARP